MNISVFSRLNVSYYVGINCTPS